jgi:hypothetical protein
MQNTFSSPILNSLNTFGGTLSVKFKIYMRQMTIFGGILNHCSTYFLSLYYYLIF